MDNIDRKYKLPPPLPTIQNGKPQPIYPLMLEHKGDNNQLFAGKYVGEIEHIYDLFYKLITCQSIDENNPLEHEAKIHNNNFYIYQNGKWVLIGDIRKPYFGAIDYMESTFDKQIDNLNYLKNEFQGIATEKTNQIIQAVEEGKETLKETKANAEQASINAKSVNIRTFANVEEMKQVSNLKAGALVKTQGFYQSGDGGGADYVVTDNIGEDEADEASIIVLQKGLYAKLLIKDFVNIKQMGAKGNGETDDTEKIQNTIDKYNNVLIPQGTFKITDGLKIKKSNFVLRGLAGNLLKYVGMGAGVFGSTNVALYPTYIFEIKSEDETEIENICIDGVNFNGDGQVFKGGHTLEAPDLTHPDPAGYGIWAIYFKKVSNIKIKNCKIENFYGAGIVGMNSTVAIIEDNFLYDCGYSSIANTQTQLDYCGDGIAVFRSFNVIIQNNTVINTRKFKVDYKNPGISTTINKLAARTGIEYHTKIIDAPLSDDLGFNNKQGVALSICNNFVYGYAKGVHLESGVTATVINNNLFYNYIGIIATAEDALISGNLINDMGVGVAPQTGYDAIKADIVISHYASTAKPYVRNALITANRLYGYRGITIENSNIVISNNLFYNSGSAIKSTQETDKKENILIDGNIFYNDEEIGGIEENYINIWGGIKNLNISNNIFYPLSNSNSFIKIWGNISRYISYINNIFNCNENTNIIIENSILTEEMFKYIGNRINNNGDDVKFVNCYNTSRCIFRDNLFTNPLGYLAYQRHGFSGPCEFSGNNGRVYAKYSLPNVLFNSGDYTSDYNYWYYQEGEKYHELAGSNTNGDKVHICTKSGYGVYTRWSSGLSVSVTKWVYNSSGKTYSAIAVDDDSEVESTVEPTFEEGEQKLEDGITWKYIGEKAEFDVKTISYV